jgi:hypothetical protein
LVAGESEIVLLISPHFGIVDAWLPVIVELKRRRPETSICAIIPEKGVGRVNPRDFVARIAAPFISRIIFADPRNQWVGADSFDEVKRPERSALFELFVKGAAVLGISKSCDLPLGCKIVLSDVFLGQRSTVHELQGKFSTAAWFCLPHGLDLRTFKIERKKSFNEQRVKAGKRTSLSEGLSSWSKLTVYAASEKEAVAYRAGYGLAQDDVKVVGVPRHCESWLRYVSSMEAAGTDCDSDYILLVSRPGTGTTGVLPLARKVQALKDIKKLAKKLERKVVVRMHPKETERDKQMVEEALGVPGLDIGWCYSSQHPFLLGRRALFAVTLFSSVALDMIAVGTPAIELCDFSGLTKSPNLARDEHGQPTSIYQQLGLVLSARNFDELAEQVDRILHDRNAVIAQLRSAYDSSYDRLDDPVGLIIDDLERFLDSDLPEVSNDKSSESNIRGVGKNQAPD